MINEFLLPSSWEVEVTVAASFFVVAAYLFFTYNCEFTACDRSVRLNSSVASLDDRNNNAQFSRHVHEQQQSEFHASSNSLKSKKPVVVAVKNVLKKLQPFIQENVLTGIYNDVFPSTAKQFFDLLLSDGSSFTSDYRSSRKDTNLNMGHWHSADEYEGQVREITYRGLCNSPMCPPDTALTEWQHALLSTDKRSLVFETVQQAHDVPFGSYFEVHCRWVVVTTSNSTSTIDVKVGVHFKKWCVMQSKIKFGATKEYKRELEPMMEVAHSCINSNTVDHKTASVAPSVSTTKTFYTPIRLI